MGGVQGTRRHFEQARFTGRLEDAEKLEQLRALEHGIPIRVWETAYSSLRVDTPEDVELVAEKLQQFDVIRQESSLIKAAPFS